MRTNSFLLVIKFTTIPIGPWVIPNNKNYHTSELRYASLGPNEYLFH